MSDEVSNEDGDGYDIKGRAFISYLDERNLTREGIVDILRFDASFVQFRTSNGTVVFIPTSRILKIKEKEVKEGDKNI